MSKKIRNSIICLVGLSLITISAFSTLADEVEVKPNDLSTAVTASSTTGFSLINKLENPIQAAPEKKGYTAKPSKNETVYVNLDAYGNIEQTNVVNGYQLNGVHTITDYGDYTNISNLTDYSRPTIEGDKISWELDEGLSEFYYQGTLNKDQIILPWDITVTYKLNGVQTPLEQLAGAKGMIETIIDVKPNEHVSDYYKNNFLLQLSTSYDLSKCLSVEAPDAVVVALGQTKSITFMALPGQEETFHIYVGSDSYESSGLNIVMAPLKMSALSSVKDLKDAKERIEDAGDAASESLDILIDSANDMKSGINSLSGGLSELQTAINAVRAEGAGKDEKVEALIDSIDTFSSSLEQLNPHLQTAQTMVNDIYQTSNNLVEGVVNLNPQLESLKTNGEALKTDLHDLKYLLDDIQESKKGFSDNIDKLNNSLKDTEQYLNNFNGSLDNLDDSLGDVKNSSNSLGSAAGSLAGSDPNIDAALGAIGASGIVSFSNNLIKDTSSVISKTTNLTSSIADNSAQLRKLTTQLKELNKAITTHEDEMDTSIDDMEDLIDNINETVDFLTDIIDRTSEAQETLNLYEDEAVSTLQDMDDLVTKTNDFVKTSNDLLAQVHTSVQNTKDGVYDGTNATFDGSLAALSDALNALNNTDALKVQKDIIKNTIDDEWDRLDDDYNLLNIDPDAEPISFVSDKNDAPDSVQIILRTPEVTIDEAEDIVDLEPSDEELTIWERIKRIFAKLFGKK